MFGLPRPMRTGSWFGLDQPINELTTVGYYLCVVSDPVKLRERGDTISGFGSADVFFKVVNDGERVLPSC